jgi:hypothetical protein
VIKVPADGQERAGDTQPCGPAIRCRERTQESAVKYLTLVALAACTFAAGCMSYTERTVVQKPVPAQPAVYTTQPVATTSTTSVSVN